MKELLENLLQKEDLSPSQATQIMEGLITGAASPAITAAFLTALRAKGETALEVATFARVMRYHCQKISPQLPDGVFCVDNCGTGGDHSSTFNISTTCSFVIAACGVPVAKHGNRSASSQSGSADLLEALGAKIDLPPARVKQSIEEVGIGFMFAPIFHPSMKNVVPVRKELQIRTVFNILGPLTNPANTSHQLIGVFKPELTEFMAEALHELGSKKALIAHGDGLDEIALHAPSQITELSSGQIKTYQFDPREYGFEYCQLDDLLGGAAQKNAERTLKILNGQLGPKSDIVVINSAAALIAAEKYPNFQTAIPAAQKAISSGLALEKLNKFIEFTNS